MYDAIPTQKHWTTTTTNDEGPYIIPGAQKNNGLWGSCEGFGPLFYVCEGFRYLNTSSLRVQ